MKKREYLIMGVIAVMVILTGIAAWAVPGLINYQGKITDTSGIAVEDGVYSMTFYLYTVESDGTSIWDEQQSVTVTEGIYSVQLGRVNPLTAAEFEEDELYLEVWIEGEHLEPRTQISSTAFALKAGTADNADSLDGLDSSVFDQSAHVGETNNPHSVTAAQTGAATVSDITWNNLSGKPSGFADDVDDTGITAETDPTVLSSVKDGISWLEISDRPAGLDDGDDAGISVESDPQVGTNSTNYVPKWNGSELVQGSIYDNGNIGIGTMIPSSKLDVDGDINTNGSYMIGGSKVFTAEGDNIFLGRYAGQYNATTGYQNTFLGTNAGRYNTTGFENTFLGQDAGTFNTTGWGNTFLGQDAGYSNTTGIFNTFVGYCAGGFNSTGQFNTFIGRSAGRDNTEGDYNIFLGYLAGFKNTEGDYNIFLGNNAGQDNTGGDYNIFLGQDAGSSNTTGFENTFLGSYAGRYNTTGYGNVFLGYNAGTQETGSNKLYIANSYTSTPLIYGEFDNEILALNGKVGIRTSSPQEALDVDNGNIMVQGSDSFDSPGEEGIVYLGSAHHYIKGVYGSGVNIGTYAVGDAISIKEGSGNVGIGTTSPSYKLDVNGSIRCNSLIQTSDERLKTNVRPITDVLDKLERIRGVRFEWNKAAQSVGAKTGEKQIGVIAQEVEAVFPELVSTSKAGFKSFDYSKLTAVLIEAVKEQQETIEELATRLDELERSKEAELASLKDQFSYLQTLVETTITQQRDPLDNKPFLSMNR